MTYPLKTKIYGISTITSHNKVKRERKKNNHKRTKNHSIDFISVLIDDNKGIFIQ